MMLNQPASSENNFIGNISVKNEDLLRGGKIA